MKAFQVFSHDDEFFQYLGLTFFGKHREAGMERSFLLEMAGKGREEPIRT